MSPESSVPELMTSRVHKVHKQHSCRDRHTRDTEFYVSSTLALEEAIWGLGTEGQGLDACFLDAMASLAAPAA